MAETLRQKNKIRHTLCESCIPEQGVFGEVWCARAEGTIWYATRSGLVVNLSDVLNNVPAHLPPRNGADGRDGISIKGDTGATGPAGRDGAPGRDGVNATGIQGPQGRPGIDCVCRTELTERRVAGIETSLRDARAETISLKAQLTTLSATVQGLLDVNKRAGEYIEWLRQRTAARINK